MAYLIHEICQILLIFIPIVLPIIIGETALKWPENFWPKFLKNCFAKYLKILYNDSTPMQVW